VPTLEIRESRAGVRTLVRQQFPPLLRRGGTLLVKWSLVAAIILAILSVVRVPLPLFKAARTLILGFFIFLPATILLIVCLLFFARYLLPRKWVFADDRLQVRAYDNFATIRWNEIASWEMRSLPNLPGYDLLVLRTRSRRYRRAETLDLLLDPSIDRGSVTELLRSRIRAA